MVAVSIHSPTLYVGVLIHGQGLTFYRTDNHVHKRADLTVHVALCELTLWIGRNDGRYPQIVYVEFGGGSENANQIVLTALEVCVCKRLANCIVYSRFPSSYSHDDGNGVFGHVNNAIRGMGMLTYDALPALLVDVFPADSTKLQVKVVDVHMVNNWTKFMKPHIDKHLCNLHKLADTQH